MKQSPFGGSFSCSLPLTALSSFPESISVGRPLTGIVTTDLMPAARCTKGSGGSAMGGMQFGARYAVEMIPLCFAYFMLCPERKQIARWECVLMSFGLVLNLIGACLVHV